MLKVKISLGWSMPLKGTNPYNNDLPIFNFTNTSNNVYNNKKFYINSEIENPDFWFVVENTRKAEIEKVDIPSNRVYLLNSETRYSDRYYRRSSKKKFINQFNKIYTPYNIYSKKTIESPPFLIWRLRGDPFEDIFEESDIEFYKNFNPEKKKLLSVYCSEKTETKTQKLRLEFVKKLKLFFGDDMDWFGYDVKTDRKLDGIVDYKYHLVLENQLKNNFISEKLYDSFLGNSYPIYAGAPNANKYFNKNSFTSINMLNFEESLKIIKECANSQFFEKNIDNINSSKNKVLDKFNFIKRIDSIVEKIVEKENFKYQTKPISIYPKIYFENKSISEKIKYSLNKRWGITNYF